ncbi:DUF4189 domain-containing protein [Nocardia alni]|uniref:DUF4189 domain-containing protein n=1 Tax=Nocardia alni TaxID=2815723 RepID=UPI001C23800F|nr:DUF4189 domain-containing protein [Nocardia alni]
MSLPLSSSEARSGGLRRIAAVGFTAVSVAGINVALAGAAHASANEYGAFSLSSNTGVVAYAVGYPDYPSAIQAANAKCGRADCHNIIQFANACGAVAQGADGRYAWKWAPSKTEAEQSSIQALGMSAPPFPDLGSASPRAAHVVLSACTPNAQ